MWVWVHMSLSPLQGHMSLVQVCCCWLACPFLCLTCSTPRPWAVMGSASWAGCMPQGRWYPCGVYTLMCVCMCMCVWVCVFKFMQIVWVWGCTCIRSDLEIRVHACSYTRVFTSETVKDLLLRLELRQWCMRVYVFIHMSVQQWNSQNFCYWNWCMRAHTHVCLPVTQSEICVHREDAYTGDEIPAFVLRLTLISWRHYLHNSSNTAHPNTRTHISTPVPDISGKVCPERVFDLSICINTHNEVNTHTCPCLSSLAPPVAAVPAAQSPCLHTANMVKIVRKTRYIQCVYTVFLAGEIRCIRLRF